MAKLYDDVMSDQVRVEPPRWILETGDVRIADSRDQFKRSLRGAVVFDVTNISDYYFGGTDKEWFDPIKDFGCVRSPFTHFWTEARRPTKIVSEVGGTFDVTRMPERVGVHGTVMDMRRPEVLKFSARNVGTRIKKWLPEAKPQRFVMEAIKNEIVDAVEMLSLRSFVELERGVLTGPMQHVSVWIREDGSIIDYLAETERVPGFQGPVERETMGFENFVLPTLMAFDMYHARNVRIVDFAPPPKLAKKHLKRRGVPMVSWKTITILPFTERKLLDEVSKPQEGTGSRPYQVMPGTFKHYGIIGPGGWRRSKLFGKVSGRFWVPQHAAGSEAAGILVKDYVVAKPDLDPPKGFEKKGRTKK